MSKFDATEGVDYLVDHYAILGVERTASPADIEAAFTAKIKQWHPDRLHGLAPQLVTQAEQQSRLLNEAHAMLGTVETRTAFDEKLKSWKKPISKDGHAIVDLGSGAFSFSALLESASQDHTEREAYAERTARQFSNFDQTTFELVREQMQASAEPSPQLKKAYAAQIAARDLYLTLLEDFLREDIGVRGSIERESSLYYVEQVDQELTKIQEEAAGTLEKQVLLLTSGKQSLLPPPESTQRSLLPATTLEHYREKLDTHIKRKAERLREIAEERETLLAERFKAAGVAYHPATTEYTSKLIMEFKKQDKVVQRILFHIEESKVRGDDSVDLSCLDSPGEDLKLIANGYSIVSLTLVSDVEFKSQILRVAELHVERMQSASQEKVPA